MLRIFFKKKAQTTLEYTILVAVIVAGLIGMQTYIKRGFSGKLRESADSMGQQYSPGETEYHYDSNSYTNSTETLDAAAITVTDIHTQQTNREGNETTGDFADEVWF